MQQSTSWNVNFELVSRIPSLSLFVSVSVLTTSSIIHQTEQAPNQTNHPLPHPRAVIQQGKQRQRDGAAAAGLLINSLKIEFRIQLKITLRRSCGEHRPEIFLKVIEWGEMPSFMVPGDQTSHNHMPPFVVTQPGASQVLDFINVRWLTRATTTIELVSSTRRFPLISWKEI